MVQNPSWLHSTFKDLSNEYPHAQIRVKTKKLWPRQVGEEKQVAVRKVCRDQESMSRQKSMSRPMSRQASCHDQCRDQQYVATDVATSSMSRPVSRPAVCHDQCRDQKALSRQGSFVATSNAEKPKKKRKLIFLT